MKAIEGKEYKQAKPEEVIDFLKTRKIDNISISPSRLKFVIYDQQPFIQVSNGKIKEFTVRNSCLKKVLRWFDFPTENFGFLQDETLLAICNDSLKAINARQVNIRLVDEQVVTINSQFYTLLTNLDVIELIKHLGITEISLNDYFMRIYTKEEYRTKPVLDDTCGFGLNVFNSETGFAAVGIQHFILRYICTNGATAPVDIFAEKQNHYGLQTKYIRNFLEGQLKKVEESRKNIIFALKKSNDEPAKKLYTTYSFKIDSIIGKWKSKQFFEGFDVERTKYDMFNFITEKAKSYDLMKKYRLERLAGELIMN